METHACNPSSWEAKSRGSWEILSQPVLHSETCLEKQKEWQSSSSRTRELDFSDPALSFTRSCAMA